MKMNACSQTAATLKRLYDILLSGAGLIVLFPLLMLIGIAICLRDGRPVIFRQRRIGQGGRPFHILKFRSMVLNAERAGLSVTRSGDPRITPIGRILRKTKLDELPQLWNVFKGEMSLVGPRPEVPHYVELYTPAQRQVLELKPGITDLATLEFRNEEELLRSAHDVEQFYITHCVPRKIELNLQYARRANLWHDSRIILKTVFPTRLKLKTIRALEGTRAHGTN